MNQISIIKKIACWAGYCLFAGYSSYMTAESVAMSFELSQVWVVFIFVFTVALLAGYCLSIVIGEIQNRINPSKSKFVLGLIGFILFWGVSFATNVHYMLMSNEGMKVVSTELGVYKNYVETAIINNTDDIEERMHVDIAICEEKVSTLADLFYKECEHSVRQGFGPHAVSYLKQIEEELERTRNQFNDLNSYRGKIYNDEMDRGDLGKTGDRDVKALQNKYSIRITDQLLKREKVIKDFYRRKRPQTKNLELIKHFIDDSLYVVDIPQITEIASPEVYYQFSKIQLKGNVFDRLSQDDQAAIIKSMKVNKTDNPDGIDKGKYRYRSYPSSRMFSTFNVWDDMLHNRLPEDMKLFGWILFSLIVDIVAFILRIFAR